MAHVLISGISDKLDGEHEITFPLTSREEHKVKLLSGVLPAQMPFALAQNDAACWVALASIALTRADIAHDLDQLWDAPSDAIGFRDDEKAEAEAPPTVAATESDVASSDTRTDVSEPGSVSPETTPSPSGPQP